MGAFAAVLVLLPALLRWVWARGSTRDLNDPALPERLFANQRRNRAVLILSIGLLLYFHPIDPFLGIPALLIARASAGYPFRKRLYGETWSLFTYLGFFTRLLIGVYGVWLLFIWVPTIKIGRAHV